MALGQVDMDSVPGLLAALNGLTSGIDEQMLIELKGKFDLGRYEEHIKAHIADFAMNLRDIPAIIENTRKDLIWRFIAAIFLAHAGIIDIRQDGNNIRVKKHETDTEGCRIPGEIEGTDRIEGLAY